MTQSAATGQQPATEEQPSLEGLLQAIDAPQQLIDAWDERQRQTAHALREGVDALHREAVARMIRALRGDHNANRILRELLQDEVVYAVLRHLGVVKPALPERIETALESTRPYLREHGGDVELVSLDAPDRVTIRLTGACDGCPASGLTLQQGVEKAIKAHCPEIAHVDKAPGTATRNVAVEVTSPFAKSKHDGWRDACAYGEVPENNIHVVEVGGQSLILSRAGARLSCFANACAHLGMPLDTATVRDGVLVCPHHGFEYLLASGECLTAPEVQLLAFAVRARAGRVEVKLP